MDDQENRNKACLTMVLWIVLIVFDVVSVPLLLLWGKLNTSTLIASVVLSVFVISIGIYAVVRTYKDHIKPARLDEKTGETTYEKRVEKIHKRRSGKDMFEVCDNFRKQYFVTMYIVIGVFALILPFVFILKFNEYESINIPIWCAFVVSAVIMAVSIFVSRKSDMAFMTSLNLKLEIKKSGFDEFYVNNDFMMATYHDLIKGFMAVGQSYCVVFSQKFCHVAEMNNIVKVQHCSKEYKLNSQTVVRHFVLVTEKDSLVFRYACADGLAADLMLGEFIKAGIETETLPTEKVK